MRIFLVLLVLIASQGISASEFDDAKARAEQGFADAQINLGLMYAKGQGTPQDYKEAVMRYKTAAE